MESGAGKLRLAVLTRTERAANRAAMIFPWARNWQMGQVAVVVVAIQMGRNHARTVSGTRISTGMKVSRRAALVRSVMQANQVVQCGAKQRHRRERAGEKPRCNRSDEATFHGWIRRRIVGSSHTTPIGAYYPCAGGKSQVFR